MCFLNSLTHRMKGKQQKIFCSVFIMCHCINMASTELLWACRTFYACSQRCNFKNLYDECIYMFIYVCITLVKEVRVFCM
jgi:hypothetical protein